MCTHTTTLWGVPEHDVCARLCVCGTDVVVLCAGLPAGTEDVTAAAAATAAISPGLGGARAGAAGMRDVCGPESDMPCPPCVCFITSKAKLKKKLGGHVAPHGGRAAPLAAGARLIAAPTPRRRHLTQRGASRRRRQNRRELAARPRQQKQQPSTSPSLLVSSRLVAGAHARDVRTCRRVRSAKDDSNREPVGAAAARGGKTHDAHLMEMLRLWHLLI